VLGLWLGASVMFLGVVGYSFPGIGQALRNNDKLAERVEFAPDDDVKKKSSTLWVLVGELNRTYFFGWNASQLGFAALTLLVAMRDRRIGVVGLAGLAALIVVALTFYLAPEITEKGRLLDFAPRDPPPPELAEFQRLHWIYTGLEAGKVVLLFIAACVGLRGRD